MFAAIRGAQAPERFSTRFLASLGFKSAQDRLFISVLKSLGFLSSAGAPQDRFFQYLDETQSEKVLAEAIRDAYSDLFQINKNAHELSKSEVQNKFKTLMQGSASESVLDKMATTFVHLCKQADFRNKRASDTKVQEETSAVVEDPAGMEVDSSTAGINQIASPNGLASGLRLGGLHYNIQIILPESRDPKVYDALFRSLREHLLDNA